jgi:hypothetical protein
MALSDRAENLWMLIFCGSNPFPALDACIPMGLRLNDKKPASLSAMTAP